MNVKDRIKKFREDYNDAIVLAISVAGAVVGVRLGSALIKESNASAALKEEELRGRVQWRENEAEIERRNRAYYEQWEVNQLEAQERELTESRKGKK